MGTKPTTRRRTRVIQAVERLGAGWYLVTFIDIATRRVDIWRVNASDAWEAADAVAFSS